MRDLERLRSKTFIVALVAVLSNVLGNFALSRGMSHASDFSMSILSPLGLLQNAWLVGGVGLLTVWTISQLSLLSWADLSYVVPVTSSTYVLTAVLGAVALHETVSRIHWAGITLIFLGVTVVGRTAPQTARVGGEVTT